MPSVRFEFTALSLGLDSASKHVRSSPKLMQRAMKRRESRLRQLSLRIVRVTPPPAKHPIRWTSERQRRYVMAKLREENNLPYERTNTLVAAWDAKFQLDGDGGAFALFNTSPVAPFVIGDKQQIFHEDTGWMYAPDVIDRDIVPLVLNDYETTWYTVSDPFAGVKT
jgi:hypothetical protein